MAAEIVWSPKSKKSVANIGAYLAEHHSEEYADKVLNGIERIVRELAEHPTKGTPTFKKGNIRRWRVSRHNYVLYSITPTGIAVKDVLAYRMNKKGF